METSYREHNVFLAKTTSKDYTVRLLYYAVAVCIYNAWCIFNANSNQDDARAIALEVKISLLLAFLSPSTLDQPVTNDNG